jgi:DNA uptake protein ComE-like DNA-binding protein
MSSDWLLPPDSSSGRAPDPTNSVSRADAVPWSDGGAGQGEVFRLIEALTARVEALEHQLAARSDQGEVAPAEEAADELTVPDFIPAVPPADAAGDIPDEPPAATAGEVPDEQSATPAGEVPPEPAPAPAGDVQPEPPADDPAAEAPADPSPDPAGATNINRMSFEELRGMGLSVNQAARVIAQRDTRGEFQSLDELDSLYGVPRELIEELKRSVTI